MKKILVLIFAFFTHFVFSADVLEKQIQEHKTRSDSLQNLILQSEEKISELALKETEQLSQLNEMEKILETVNALIKAAEKQIDSVNSQKEITQMRLEETEKMLDIRKEIMLKRLKSIYKMGEPTILSIILGSNSPEDIVRRIRYMQDLNKYDRNLLDTIHRDEEKLQSENEILQAENEVLQILLKERQTESEKAKEQAAARKKFLDELRSEKNKWETSMTEYKNAQNELNEIIDNLIAETLKSAAAKKTNFAEKKGSLPWAVSGKIIADFGKITHPEYKTTIVNNGIDIEAPIGTPVKSAASGMVEFVGRMRGYGKLMIINHFGGYFTIYAHLNENFFEKGAEVGEGQTIGSVGESGSLEGSKLHFEIRRENTALNPSEWLKKI